MAISERTLEENEAKIDNILHKVISATEQIKQLCSQINERSTGSFLMERIRRINILSEIVYHLSHLADDIDIADQKITQELETKIRGELDKAISDITEAKHLLEVEEEAP